MDNSKPQLSPLEMQILTLMAKGCTAEEIAEKINRTVHVVRDNRKAIYEKFNANKNVQAVVKALYYDILQIENIIDKSTLPTEQNNKK